MAKDVEASIQDLTSLDWSESSISSATGGSYLKARFGEGSAATYFKLSCYDEINGVYGHECVNEILAARLMDVLCISHVPYQLVHARVRIGGKDLETWITASPSFRKQGESKVALARFYRWNYLNDEGRIEFCARFGWAEYVQKMMLIDYLIGNRDRHGGNLEVLKAKDGQLRMAPLFDNGMSLCFSTGNARQLRLVDPLQDIVANNFLGSRSLEENLLRFVSPNLPIGRLCIAHKDDLVQDLAPALDQAVEGIDGQEFLEFLWRMIWERWCRYENLRDSGCLKA